MKRRDIRLEPSEEKEKVYEEISALYSQGKKVTLKEHKSGFPAVTVDCEDCHIITDILSLEEWWSLHKKHGGEDIQPRTG